MLFSRCKRGHVTYRLLEADPTTNHTERHANDEPDQDQRKHCAKWDSTTGPLRPYEEIEKEESAEDDPGDQQWGQDDIALPSFAAKGLVDSRRNVATDGAEKG